LDGSPKTLVLTENFPPKVGGSGRYLFEIYSRLDPDRHVIAAGVHPRQREFDASHGLPVVRVPLALPAWGLRSVSALAGYWRTYKAVRRLARAHGVTRLHCGRCLPEGWVGWLLKKRHGLPYACYVYGEELNYSADSRELSWMMRRVLRGADFVVAISRNTERIVRDDWGLPAGRVRLLYPGVDTNQFVPAARCPAARARLGWGDRPVVLTVGRLQERKGHDTMIRALAEVRKTVPDVLYAIAGDGEERPRLEELARREGLGGHVQFLSEIDDAGLLRAYQQCDLFALPNRQVGQDIEGFGIVLIEAQACGKPVIAGASGGTAETLSEPETGSVIDCSTPAELGPLVAAWLADRPRLARMGEAARAWAVERFDWAALGRRAGELFRDGRAGNELHQVATTC
jgi:phosphatidylinositol alpha-1,6-mannosyltransferase